MRLVLSPTEDVTKTEVIDQPTVDQLREAFLGMDWRRYASLKLEFEPDRFMEVFGAYDIGRKVMYSEGQGRVVSADPIKSTPRIWRILKSYYQQDDRWQYATCWEPQDDEFQLPPDFSPSRTILKGLFYLFWVKLRSLFGLRPRTGSLLHVREDDPDMNQAIEQARATLPLFFQALEHQNPGCRDFVVKYKIMEKGATEHFWLRSIKEQDGRLTGIIDNDAQMVKSVTCGQRLEIDTDHITDWGYYDHDVGQGYFTLRVLIKDLGRRERRHLLETLGWNRGGPPDP